MPSSVTVIRKPSGRFFVSFVVEIETDPLPLTNQRIGIDFGLTRLATLSIDGLLELSYEIEVTYRK